MMKLETATRKLLARTQPLPTEEVAVARSCGRILREDLRSPHAIPPFAKSAMDGFALRAADTAGATTRQPVVLKVLEDIPAGRVGRHRVKRGTAARIMTGAPLPAGADAVVMVEDTVTSAEGARIRKPLARGANVAPAGEDVAKGARVLRAGDAIGAAEMGMIAATGRHRVVVSRRPQVRIISTGSEIIAPGKPPKPGRIYDANGYSLTGLAVEWGADARFLGIAPDRAGALERKLARAADADLVVLSGGVSVGDYDLVRGILLEAGFETIFYKVRIKPGMPTFAGVRDGRFVLGLPGNPVSCMVTFVLFAGPLLDAMLGKKERGPRRGRARLSETMRLKPDRRKLLRGILREEEGRLLVAPFPAQKAGVLRSMVAADALIDVPEGVTRLRAGSLVDIVYL